MTQKVYVGDTGTLIQLDCMHDISAATALSIKVRKPDGTLVTWPAVARGTTVLEYTTDANSLDMNGVWKLQALVTLPSGTWRGETAQLPVFTPFG